MTGDSEHRFYQGPRGRVPWMKPDASRRREVKSLVQLGFKVELIVALKSLKNVFIEIVRRADDDITEI